MKLASSRHVLPIVPKHCARSVAVRGVDPDEAKPSSARSVEQCAAVIGDGPVCMQQQHVPHVAADLLDGDLLLVTRRAQDVLDERVGDGRRQARRRLRCRRRHTQRRGFLSELSIVTGRVEFVEQRERRVLPLRRGSRSCNSSHPTTSPRRRSPANRSSRG